MNENISNNNIYASNLLKLNDIADHYSLLYPPLYWLIDIRHYTEHKNGSIY